MKTLLEAVVIENKNIETVIEENEAEVDLKEQDNNEKIEGDYEVEETLINMD